MKPNRFLSNYAVLVVALLAVNPAMQAAKKKTRLPQREPVAKSALAIPAETFQRHVEQEIAGLRDDVYTRATWKKLQEVKQQADDTAGSLKIATLSAAFVSFVLGCVVTFFVVKRMDRSNDSLKIT